MVHNYPYSCLTKGPPTRQMALTLLLLTPCCPEVSSEMPRAGTRSGTQRLPGSTSSESLSTCSSHQPLPISGCHSYSHNLFLPRFSPDQGSYKRNASYYYLVPTSVHYWNIKLIWYKLQITASYVEVLNFTAFLHPL